MKKYLSILAKVTIMGAFVVLTATGAQAQCGNGNVQESQDEDCDNGTGNNTQTIGCCAAGCVFAAGGTTCRPDAGICDNGAETCTGNSGACPADGFASSTTPCRASTSVCDAVEFCTGSSGACPGNAAEPNGTVCRESEGGCDPEEVCDGTNTACPADIISIDGTLCRADSGACDPGPDTCDGTNPDCPEGPVSSQGVVCRSAAGECDIQEVCDGTNSTCPEDLRSSALCRPAVGDCDVAEFCDGGVNCPGNGFEESDVVCRESEGGCDPEELCTGTSNLCPEDDILPNGTLCREDSGACDLAPEFCDGTSPECPQGSVAPEGTLCRPEAIGGCDIAEECDGTNSTCPDDDKRTSVCRAAAGDCDVAESCDGTNNLCPEDDVEEEGVVCRDDVNPICDVAEECDGTNAACPDDELLNCEDDDEDECTEATCDELLGCVLGDACVEICRSPGFWSTHSGEEKGINVGQEVLDEAGPLQVCGQTIESTTEGIGSLLSSLEGLCVKTQGVKQRQLYRQLVTTAFNCAISEGGDCDNITDDFMEVSYDECNALCAGEDVGEDGPTLEECKANLSCFNTGGRMVDGDCAKGTCEEDTEVFCNGDFGACPEINDVAQDCIPFEDACNNVPICSEDLDADATICPKPGPASSPKTCRDVRHNECTIDDCVPADSCEGRCGGQAPSGCWCDQDICEFGDGCFDAQSVCGIICN